MSDDSPRSASGNRPDQRRNMGAPQWWSALERADLPDDALTGPHSATAASAATEETVPRDRPTLASVHPSAWLLKRWRAWAINALIVATAAVVILVGVGATTPRSVVAAMVLFGIPIGLAAFATTIIARRAR